MKVDDLMTVNPLIVRLDTSLDDVFDYFSSCGLRHLPVLKNDKVVGMVSDRDLRLATGWLKTDARRTTDGETVGPTEVREIMKQPVYCIEAGQEVRMGIQTMLQWRIGGLPVLRDGKLVGMLTEQDCLRGYLESVEEGASDPSVSEVMRSELVSVEEGAVLNDVLETCRTSYIRHLPVVDGEGRLTGIVSDRDCRTALGQDSVKDAISQEEGALAVAQPTVDQFMTKEVETVESETPLSEAVTKMLEGHFSALPVCDDGELKGIITLTDLLLHYRHHA